MNTTRKVWASVVALFAACLLPAADSKPIARVISVLEIETDDASGYATWIAEYNQIAKAKLGVDSYLRVYQTMDDGAKSGRVRVTVAGKSVSEVLKQAAALENDPAIVQNRQHLQAIRQIGGRTLYQAVRFDGTDKNAWLYTTLAVVTDEPGYLKALDQLRVIFDANGLKDARINCYRILAGRTTHTHRITIVLPAAERLGAFLDLAATNAALGEWLASSAKYRTVVSNTTSREITK
jgi:hypothetical protein